MMEEAAERMEKILGGSRSGAASAGGGQLSIKLTSGAASVDSSESRAVDESTAWEVELKGVLRSSFEGRYFNRRRLEPIQTLRTALLPVVLDSFERLKAEAELVEGAGSPAEMNLRDGDIANLGFAEAADVPIVLVGDIDRGGLSSAHGSSCGRRRIRVEADAVAIVVRDPVLDREPPTRRSSRSRRSTPPETPRCSLQRSGMQRENLLRGSCETF
jgi:hypothetical protein